MSDFGTSKDAEIFDIPVVINFLPFGVPDFR
jgi:hypothetical protein